MSPRRLLPALLGGLLILTSVTVLAVEKRVALVIGNNDYVQIPKLEKAVNDAKAVSQELSKAGFEVIHLANANRRNMNLAINDFAQRVSAGGTGVFFFAGHGLQINNQNFLLPVDMDMPHDPNDVEDQAISLIRVQDKLADAKARFSLLVIDACRDNPLPRKAGRSLGSTRGLAQPASPNGQIVLFSAGANQQALDKLSDQDNNPNGLFTREFLPLINSPGVSAIDALKKVRSSVSAKAKTVGHEQNPALYDQTDGDFYFVAPTGPKLAAAGPSQAALNTAVELEYWSSIKNSSDPAAYAAYLERYPQGQFATIAQRRLSGPSTGSTRSGTENGGQESVPQPAPRLALASPPPPAQAPGIAPGAAPAPMPAPGAPTKASKIEMLGQMTYLTVSDLRASRRDNLLRIQAEITNTHHDNQRLYYRFKWLDRDGFSVWDDEPWKPLVVYGKQKQLIQVVSPTFKAEDFRLVLQSPDNDARQD